MTGRVFAYLGLVVGLSISVAANAMHAKVDPRAPWWAPWMAAAWPLLLFLALEVLTRTRWADGRSVTFARGGVAVVALVAAALSYAHLRGLLVTAGEAAWAAALGPFAIDGLMAVSAAALLGSRVEEPASPATAVAPADEVEPSPQVEDVPEVAAPEPVAPAPPRLTKRRPVKRPGPTRITDADLLARVDGAVAAGELTAADITGNRLRGFLSVGAERAGRVAEQWHETHRRTAVAAVGN